MDGKGSVRGAALGGTSRGHYGSGFGNGSDRSECN